MRMVKLSQPKQIVFGCGCLKQCIDDIISSGKRRVFIVFDPNLALSAETMLNEFKKAGLYVTVYSRICGEPTIEMFEEALVVSKSAEQDTFIGLGGGSVLDVTKLLSVLTYSEKNINDVFGIDKLRSRNSYLVCLPTTAGTGSEVSPIAVLTDTSEKLKKGVVSHFLIPDSAYIDPILTLSLPPSVTASTGMDTLTHCIESYANLNSHRTVDLYALEGIRLIGANIERVVSNGQNVEAREFMSLGSMYGGLCLAPVNTAGVHALAFPLGGRFGIPHGVANALLLPHVMNFNLDAAPERYAEIAVALGIKPSKSAKKTAELGINRVIEISNNCGIVRRLSELGITEETISGMAESALTVTRLLKNNLRKLTKSDAENIYRQAM